MATSTQQGTGKHPHKSAAEPEPHHEAPTTTGSKSTSSTSNGGSHKAESHKAEPHKAESHKKGAEPQASSNGSSDLESRAYTGPDGQEHHHTKTYMEQHKGDSQ